MAQEFTIEFLDEIKKELKEILKTMLIPMPFDKLERLAGESRAYIKILAAAGYSFDVDMIINKPEPSKEISQSGKE